MADQETHNVVDLLSRGAEAALEADTNQTITLPAESGTTLEQSLQQKATDALQTSQESNSHAASANATVDAYTVTPHAEPSAGNAAAVTEKAPTIQEPIVALHAPIESTITANNIENGQLDDVGSVDVSVNSDTEGSRGDASEQKKEDSHHVRTNSVKKPATFSKVSVTKNFLAKSASGTPTLVKPTDKPSPVGTPPAVSAARPRLIAKTGASLRDSQKAGLRAEGTSGPDASKVWNKNRRKSYQHSNIPSDVSNVATAVAPPPPKQFTDEELKQQYGIHLATRLQTDENGKEAKWADIDDDEDDWAPDTVVWMDGTKSTLTPQDAATPQKEQKPSSPQPQKPSETARPTLALKRPTELGPTKTILKPGASAAAAQAKQSGATAVKPTDKSMPQSESPAPSKSPWAPLPPVDKISPVNPPVQQQRQQAPMLATQDARAYEPQPPRQPAREIAADTFDRSWRDGEGGARELFNSANGRYEPVAEGRRGSIKPDTGYRKPSLLQRGSQSVVSPAEPSAAFQTRTTTQMDSPWARRRGSSVSQGSIPPARRVSTSKGSDVSPAPERRTSTVIGHDMRTSPKITRNEPAPPNFSQQSAWQQQMPPKPESGTEEPREDPVEVQARIMREKRELAKQRREEEEQRLEAEKQERLKARLAQLEGAGKSRKEREAEAAKAAEVAGATMTSEQPVEVTSLTAKPADVRAQPSHPAEMAAAAAPALEAQSLPPAPTEAQPKQPSPGQTVPSPLPSKPSVTASSDAHLSADQNQRQAPRPHLSPQSHQRTPFSGQPSPYGTSSSAYPSATDRKQAAFGRSPMQNNDAFSSPWPTASNGNVWGTSGIGNGTFESANTFAPMQQTSALPPPPGMTRPSPSARISPQSISQDSRSPNLQQSLPEPHRGFAPPGFESRPDPFANQMRANGPSPGPAFGRQPHAPGPIAPPSRAPPQQASSSHEDKLRAWNQAKETLPQQYQLSSNQAAERAAHRVAPTAPREDTIKETFKKTSAQQGRLGAPRKYDEAEYTIHDAQGSRSVQTLSPAPPHTQTQPAAPIASVSPLQTDPWKQAGDRTVRIPDGSLNAAHGGARVQQPPIGPPPPQQNQAGMSALSQTPAAAPPSTTTKDQSPPPPDSSLHPVNSGSGHPLVKLPPGKPVVKLPPPPSSAQQLAMNQQPNVMMPQRPISNLGAPGSSKPIVMSQQWQERFNGLFKRTAVHTEVPPSPPKTPPKAQDPALAITASSRAVMDEAPATAGATVSLPQSKKMTTTQGFTIDDSSDIVSKSTIEPMFMEELGMGSKPKIAFPRNVVYPEIELDDIDKGAMLNAGTTHKPYVDARSAFTFNIYSVHPRRKEGVFVNIPQVKIHNRLVKSYSGNRNPSGQHQDRKPSAKFNKPKAKESSPAAGSGPNADNVKLRSRTEAPMENTTNGQAGTEKKKTVWAKPPKGPRRGPPRAASGTQQSATPW
jgi:hypothetical protein